MIGIDRHRCDRRENAISEISFEPRRIGGGQRGTIDDQNTFGRELVAQGPPALLLIARELRRGLSDPCQKLGGRGAIHGGFGLAGLDLLDGSGDADHGELVKIAGGNR